MLFLCDLSTDVEPINKEKTGQPINSKIAMLIATMIVLLIVVSVAGIMIAAKMKTPQNVSPYCLYIKNEGKTCKIHNIKHEGQNLKALVISENEMALHQKLYEEVSRGAYFDGKRLYKEEDASEILAIYDTYQKEKEALFEKYLEGTLDEERTERYNSIIEELADLEETISKLNIEVADNSSLTKEELISEIEELKKQLDEIKIAQLSTADAVSTVQDEPQSKEQTEEKEVLPLQETKQNQEAEPDALLYVARPATPIVIPKDIQQAATIKKSSLYQ